MELAANTTENLTDLSALETLLDTTAGNDAGADGSNPKTTNEELKDVQAEKGVHHHAPTVQDHTPDGEDEKPSTIHEATLHSALDTEHDREPPIPGTAAQQTMDSGKISNNIPGHGDLEDQAESNLTTAPVNAEMEEENGGKGAPEPMSNGDGILTRLIGWRESSPEPIMESSQEKRKRTGSRPRRRRDTCSPPPSPLFRDHHRGYVPARSPYPTAHSPYYQPDPPNLTFFWASQIDVEIGSFASPWKPGMYRNVSEALGIMVDIATTALSDLEDGREPADPNSKEIRYVKFPGDILLNDLWSHLRDGGHTWPAYAMNGRGGITEPSPHEQIPFVTFPNETLPPLLLVETVAAAKYSTSGLPTDHLIRERTVEIASLDYWLSNAAATSLTLNAEVNLDNIPSILEEIWTAFWDEISDVVREKWSSEGNFQDVQRLAISMSRYIDGLFPSKAVQYFLWVAFLRATKVWQCVTVGADTSDALDLFNDDLLIYLA